VLLSNIDLACVRFFGVAAPFAPEPKRRLFGTPRVLRRDRLWCASCIRCRVARLEWQNGASSSQDLHRRLHPVRPGMRALRRRMPSGGRRDRSGGLYPSGPGLCSAVLARRRFHESRVRIRAGRLQTLRAPVRRVRGGVHPAPGHGPLPRVCRGLPVVRRRVPTDGGLIGLTR
jgi:hypothetical protein